jgi:glycosyltransferase involved in cell wall biosynthesis
MKSPSPPAIAPLPQDGKPCPFWSVMMPAYNPSAAYLEAALRSVLQQAPGPDRMQIEVVDDCTPGMDVAALVKGLAGERVAVSKTPRNLGLAGCWNACIGRSRGEWVHIFHQDDLVLPGFYDRLKVAAQSRPMVGAAFCRPAFVDEDGHWFHLRDLEQRKPGVLENWLPRIAVQQRIETPSIVVRRSVYEDLGGFLTELCYALDWEMWRRIAARYPVWYEPQILACYRLHAQSASSRLAKANQRIDDVLRSIEVAARYLPPGASGELSRQARRQFALMELGEVAKLTQARDFSGAQGLIWECLKISRARAVVQRALSLSGRILREKLRPGWPPPSGADAK